MLSTISGNRAAYSLTLTNRADIDQRTFFEDYGSNIIPCKTCHCRYGQLYFCRKCKAVICEACINWSKTDVRVIDLNENKRTKAKQRYVLKTLTFNSYNCNSCSGVVGYRL